MVRDKLTFKSDTKAAVQAAKKTGMLMPRPMGDSITTRIDLGPGYGVHDIPEPVARYIDEVYQEGAAMQTRIASKSELLSDSWMDRPPPKIIFTRRD